MNFNLLVKFTAFSFFALIARAQSNVGSNFTSSSTLELTGLASGALIDNSTSAGTISGSVLEIRCLLLVRQKGNWKDPNTGKSGSVSFGPYEGNGNTVAVQFKDFGIPNGVLANLWFTVDFSSPCVAHYTCSGNVFKYTYTYTGLTCGGSPSPSPSNSAPAPSGTAVPKFGQCGGIGWTGSTVCVAGTVCTHANDFFSQCL
ncbi:hypothetical protein ONZ45_g9792 [Pleurotus djamor]|nr:hypothetical protein ONZ45_g9792 [Pleurotus djamor]